MNFKQRFLAFFPKSAAARSLMLLVVMLLGFGGVAMVAFGDPSHVQNRSDMLSDSRAGATAINNVGFQITDTSQALGSIQLLFCQESPLPGFPCSTPAGFDASGATLTAQSGNTGFSVLSATSNAIILTRTAATPTTVDNTYTLSNIVNPNTQESYYLRIFVYPTTDGSGTETQNGGVALATTGGLTVSATVPPFLELCTGLTIQNNDCSTASGNYVNFGNFDPNTTASATSQLAVATNAQNGYSVTAQGSTLTSGNNDIPALTMPTASLVGTSQFGVNLTANTVPVVGANPTGSGFGVANANYAITNSYLFKNGDTIITSPLNTDYQTFTVSYITNVNAQQSPGVYVTTLTYICLANF